VLLAAAVFLLDRNGALAYQVQPGDTLWAISRRTGISIADLAARNHIRNPDRIYAGQQLDVTPPAPAPPAEPDRAAARALLVNAARQHGVDPALVLAVAYWESGWNQSEVSPAGAVGLMQVTPGTARWAGPALLHRPVDVHRADDNAALGAALLRRYLDEFHDEKLALAAYYQGEMAVRRHGIYPSSHRYIDGILALRDRVRAGKL